MENEVKKFKVIRSEEVSKMMNQKLQLMKEFQKKYFDSGEVRHYEKSRMDFLISQNYYLQMREYHQIF